MNWKTLQHWWWLGGIIFVNVPVLITILTVATVVWRDPDFIRELFTEVLTRENVAKFNALWMDYEKRMGVE